MEEGKKVTTIVPDDTWHGIRDFHRKKPWAKWISIIITIVGLFVGYFVTGVIGIIIGIGLGVLSYFIGPLAYNRIK